MAEKRALMLASVASMIDQFNIPNIKLLQALGYRVDVVADFTNPGTITAERSKALKSRLSEMNAQVYDIAIPRSLSPRAILMAYKKVRKLVSEKQYDLIHCHSPIGGAICRLAARKERKKGTRVIYTAHGFHFYTGAPLKNWLIFYPIEKWLSRYTDELITINKEDFERAIKHFHAKKTVCVHGIGIDIDKVAAAKADGEIRRSCSIGEEDIMLLSVGELNDNKNHETALKALSALPKRYKYVIVGKGEKRDALRALAEELKIEDRVSLVGFQNNVLEYYKSADAFIFPSYREGLSVALMEAMAAGLPVVCSRIRGNTDLIEEKKGGFLFVPSDWKSLAEGIQQVFREDREKMGSFNREKIALFSIQTVAEEMKRIYETI